MLGGPGPRTVQSAERIFGLCAGPASPRLASPCLDAEFLALLLAETLGAEWDPDTDQDGLGRHIVEALGASRRTARSPLTTASGYVRWGDL